MKFRKLLAVLLSGIICAGISSGANANTDRTSSDKGAKAFANGVANPSMGLGLNGVTYWSPSFPFINLFKQATAGELVPFEGSGGAPILFDKMKSNGWLDENGWPTQIPEGYYWQSNVVIDSGYVPSQRGRYFVRYHGQGDIRIIHNGRMISNSPGLMIFDILGDEPLISVTIHSTEASDHIRNISIVLEENRELFETGAIFNPRWLALVQDMRVLRFMDWQFTNGSKMSRWEDRAKLDSISWGVTHDINMPVGVPIEAMVHLANITGTDPWFNIPFEADDHYVREFARYVNEHLDPELMAYFEYSNEVWNWIFQQTHSSSARGQKRFGDRFGGAPAREYYGYRSAQISDLIQKQFSNAKQRVHMTLATQTDDQPYSLEMAHRGVEVYLKESGKTTKDLFKSVAATWYFGIPAELNSHIANWVEQHGEAKAKDMLFEQMSGKRQLIPTAAPEDNPTVQRTINHIKAQADWAKKYGLQVITYEGGTHLIGYGDYNEPLAEFFISVNNDPRMGALYQQIHDGWLEIKEATLLNHFVEVSRHTRWGSWGALQHLEDSTARWDFIVKANTQEGVWESRSLTAFDQGSFVKGDRNKNDINGTGEEDYLLGGGGDDVIRGGGNDDGLHGGDGVDTLVGGEGNDVLVGGRDGDNLTGGKGADRFVLTLPLSGADVLTDFSQDDVLDLRDVFLITPRLDKLDHFVRARQISSGVVIEIDIDGSEPINPFRPAVTLQNVTSINIKSLIGKKRILLH